MERHNRGDRFGDGGKYSRMPSRWPSDTPPNQNQHQRFPRGGGIAGGGEGFAGGRYHPYRGPQDYSSAGGQGFRDAHGDLGGHQMPMGGQKRGFAGRGGGSPDYGEGNKFAKLFVGSVPKTATEEDIRPLFEEHGDVVEVALIKDWRTGHQQGFCFIKYASSEHADRAIRALHNQYTLPGATGPIQVKYADGERERFGTEDKLFVASLNRRATEKEVEEIFAVYGHVEDVYLMKDEMKQSRGCGFVKFSSRDMALAAMNALHGTFVMRGCDQPLIVRFAEPKRPRPGDQRSAPAYGGPGFGPQSDAVILNRQSENFEEPRGGHIPHKGWAPLSPQSGGPPSQSSSHGFGSQTAGMGGIASTLVVGPGSFGDGVPPTNGALPNLAPISSSSQSFNPPIAQAPPAIGQQILPLQKSLPLPQNLPPALPFHNAVLSFSHAQTQALQAPMQQLGQFQLPQSVGLNSFSQAQQVPGLSGQLSASPSLTPQNATAATLQNPLGLQQQGFPTVPNQQQLPLSNISQQLLQQPGHQLPTQMLLQQQAQTLQSSYQSSQQAIFQIQQQLQMMQHSNISQQQSSQSSKQQSPWSGPPPTSTTTASMHGTAIPSAISTNPSHALSVPSGAVASTCNWTEHTSPEGFKYYYNSATRESKWEKPEELTVFEQQQQQKLLFLQQQQQQLQLQQQKIAAPQLKSPSHTPSQMQVQTQVQPIQQVAQTQVQPQMQPRQQAQLQILQPSLSYQASGAAGHQTVQDLSNPQLHGAGSVSQEWAWKNKPTGS